MDTREIRRMTNIYEPDCIVCIDPTLSRTTNIFEGVKPNATLVQSTRHPLSELQLPPAITTVGLCDAVSIALDVFGRTITNTIMLGAFARTTGVVALASLEAAIAESEFRDAGLAQNLRALQLGYAETRVHHLDERVAA